MIGLDLKLDLERLYLWTLARIGGLWIRPTALPVDRVLGLRGRGRRVIYVLEEPAVSDLVALQLSCWRHGLPPAIRRLRVGEARASRSTLALERSRGVFGLRRDRRLPTALVRVIEAAVSAGDTDIDLLPVAVFWGRAPSREPGWLALAFSAGWAFTGPLSRLIGTLVNGRMTFVHFGAPVALATLMADDPRRLPRRIAKHCRAELATTRIAVLGPDLSHRRTLAGEILMTRAVRAAAAARVRSEGITRRAALLGARRYVNEIAADYSPRFVTIMSHVLGRLWNRLYDGVEVLNAERLAVADRGAQLIYVPAHRSHMDYLLLSYVIYHRGYPVPHIAAGINLNLPVVGSLLRKGGAFYIRRGFRGDELYPAVFAQYLARMMARGHSVEYFIEGGRSRTGRLLPAKTGMLSMTVRSYLADPRRPVVFVPVFFAYERIFEARDYLAELSGSAKRKESVLGLLATLPKLKRRFGRVYVSFGEPLPLGDMLDAAAPAWRQPRTGDGRPAWLAEFVTGLARRIEQHINGAAVVSPVALLATVLLAMPKQAMVARDLEEQLELCRTLLPGVWMTPLRPVEMIEYGLRMGIIARVQHPLGDIIKMPEDAAILSTYPRNNVLHLFALPSLIGCAFLDAEELSSADLVRLAGRVYPYVAEELCLPLDLATVPARVEMLLERYAELGLLERIAAPAGEVWRRPPAATAQAMQLSVLAQVMLPLLERYYLVLAALLEVGSGAVTQHTLEARCQAMASRIAVLYELASPDFSDKTLFRDFIDRLRDRAVLGVGADGTLTFDATLEAVAADARRVLAERIRHSVLQATLSEAGTR